MAGTTKVILVKKESSYGADSAPDATNAILTRNFQSNPVQVDRLERNLDVPTRGVSKAAVSGRRGSSSYEVEMAGSGAAGTAPAWMELLEGCGMGAPTLTATTKAEQKFGAVGTPLSSLTEWHWKDNQKRVKNGVRGTFGMTWTANAYPFLRLNWLGLIPAAPVVQATPLVPDFTAWQDPVELNIDNSVFTLDGYAAPLRELTIDAEANVALRSLVGQRYINKANHALNFRAVVEAPDIGTKNFWSMLGSLVPMHVANGIGAGNIVQLDSANAQILAIEEAEEDDVLMLNITGQLVVVAGSDDLLITAK